MEIREATPSDSDRISDIAESTFQSSYALSPEKIATLVDEHFAVEALAERLDGTDHQVLAAEAEVDGERAVNGFVDRTASGRVRWLHVDPEARGQGIGTALVEHLLEEREDGPVVWELLEEAVEGETFCERFGLTAQGRDQVDIGGHEFVVRLYAEGERTEYATEPGVSVPETVRDGGEDRPLDPDDPIPGRDAPFFRTFVSSDRESAYGYFCSQCGSTEVAADGQDRLECNECGNVHLADEWDGAYL